MHHEYPKKFRKLFTDFGYILPTQYETFYSVLKQICSNIKTNDVTPEIINQLSTVYKTVKQMLEIESKQISTQILQEKQENSYNMGKSNFSASLASNYSPKRSREGQESKNCLYYRLNMLILGLEKYFPNHSTAKLIYHHFIDSWFYARIQEEREKGEAVVDEILGKGNMAESGSMTPLAVGLKGQGKRKLLGKIVNQRGTTCKIHINGNNQLAVIFWINCFKSDYAVHFDVFWAYFQYYVNTVLTKNKSQKSSSESAPFYSTIFPYPCNPTTKSRIHSLIDPDSKYYITSANCSNLFMLLSQHELVEELIELSLRKDIIPGQKKSQKCLSLKYGWSIQGTKGTVWINNFTTSTPTPNSSLPPIHIPPSFSLQLPPSSIFYLTGNSIGHQTKILTNKYQPTIRFGSLNDNEICIKNKYVSRRQFMIIEEIVYRQASSQQNSNRKYEDSFDYDRYKKSENIGKQQNKLSCFYLVCLSPTNHTCLLYPYHVEAKSGLIFKFQGVFVQIVHVSNIYRGIAGKKTKTDPNQIEMIKNQSAVELNLSKSIDQDPKQRQKTNNNGLESNFELLTMVPICKTEENQVNEDDKTLLQLPKNKNQIVLDCQLQCMFISGQNSNNKFIVNIQKPVIEIQSEKGEVKIFKFEIKDQKFYLPAKTKILAKRANQVLEGHLSDKVLLEPGMKISLQEIEFQVLQ